MKNPDYQEDRAHLPNADDLKRWNETGRAKEAAEQARQARVRAKNERLKKEREATA